MDKKCVNLTLTQGNGRKLTLLLGALRVTQISSAVMTLLTLYISKTVESWKLLGSMQSLVFLEVSDRSSPTSQILDIQPLDASIVSTAATRK
jgi:hypothetical protein